MCTFTIFFFMYCFGIFYLTRKPNVKFCSSAGKFAYHIFFSLLAYQIFSFIGSHISFQVGIIKLKTVFQHNVPLLVIHLRAWPEHILLTYIANLIEQFFLYPE